MFLLTDISPQGTEQKKWTRKDFNVNEGGASAAHITYYIIAMSGSSKVFTSWSELFWKVSFGKLF